MEKGRDHQAALLFLLLSLLPVHLPAASHDLSWDFESVEDLNGWIAEGVESSVLQDGVLRLLGKEEVQLVLPPGLNIEAGKDRYLKMRLRVNSPRQLLVMWEPRGYSGRLPSIAIRTPFKERVVAGDGEIPAAVERSCPGFLGLCLDFYKTDAPGIDRAGKRQLTAIGEPHLETHPPHAFRFLGQRDLPDKPRPA